MTTIGFKGFVPGVEQPVQAALESEEAWIARLKRQRQIIKAYYEKRRAASQAGPLPMGERQDLAKAA
jgi:hypothetical protein